MKYLSCSCGQRIGLDDLEYIAYHTHTMGANRVYVRFHCPACGRSSERSLTQSAWDEFLLTYLGQEERTLEEWVRMEQMGPITEEEIRQVRRMLRQGNPLESLRLWEQSQREEERPE